MSASVTPDSSGLIWSQCGGEQQLIQSLTGVGNSCQSHGCLHLAEALWFRQKSTVLGLTQSFLDHLVCASQTVFYNSVSSQPTLRSGLKLRHGAIGNGSITHNGHYMVSFTNLQGTMKNDLNTEGMELINTHSVV